MKNNKGFSFVVVIMLLVITAIMVVTAIAIVNSNWKMKQTEKNMTQSTASAETGLTYITDDLQLLCQECLEKAYTETLELNGNLTTEAMNNVFAENYITQLNTFFNTNIDSKLEDYLENNLDDSNRDNYEYMSGVTSGVDIRRHRYTLYNVSVKYKNGSDEETVITDIQIDAPILFNDTNTSNILANEYGKYSLITDRTIDFGQEANANVRVVGNVYAGGNTDNEEGLHISGNNTNVTIEANRVITRKDIGIYTGMNTLKFQGYNTPLAEVYVRNIETKKNGILENDESIYVLNAESKMYVSGDLLLNRRYCDVKLVGEYRGYSPEESSICINGRFVNADLTGLTTLLLSGVSYLDIPVVGSDTDANIGMGDSLTGKFSQSIYMVPAACVYDTSGKPLGNPIMNNSVDDLVLDWSYFEDTYGIDITRYIDLDNPVITLVPKNAAGQSIENGQRTYLYLNFKSQADATRYLQTFDSYFNNYLTDRANAFNYGNIVVGDDSALFTVGNIISNKDGRVTVLPNTMNVLDPYVSTQDDIISKEYASLSSTLLPFAYTGVTTMNSSLYDFIINSESINNPEQIVEYNDTTLVAEKDTPWECDLINEGVSHGNAKDVITFIHDAKYTDGSTYFAVVCQGDVLIQNNCNGIVITNGKCTINPGVDFHGTIIAKDGIIVMGSSIGISNRGYEDTSVLTWFLDTYTYKDIIRETFRQVNNLNGDDIDAKSVRISYKNWIII